MDEMSRSELLRRNEQIKAASSLAGNAGLPLVAAAMGRWYFEGVDGDAILWLVAGAIAMSIGVRALIMLEAEY